MQPSSFPRTLRLRSRTLAPAFLALLALAACAEDKAPPPAATLSPGQSPNASAYDSTATPPMGSEATKTAPTIGSQSMAPAPLPQTATSSPSNTPGTPSIDQGAGGILLPVTAKFLVDRPDMIEVSIRDAQAADRVQLVAPDGGLADAFQLDRETIHAQDTGSSGFNFGVGVSGGSSSGVQPSFGIGFPLFGGAPNSPQRDEVQTKALIKVPDMAAYRANWQHTIVRIYLGEKSVSPRKMEMAAPAPPS
ncbi:hypothetical protein [Hypericibacter sp.]|uniref:hypothetical protein n=1 Tax=Hypericibacter sp. TaxID=2705401 RepID=UPI003D6D0F28